MSAGRRTRRPDTQLQTTFSRYDIVLALIPMALVLTAITAQLLGIELPFALAAGAVIAAAVIVDTLFVNPPTGRAP